MTNMTDYHPSSPVYKVPMSSPDIDETDRQAVNAVMMTPNLSMGSQILKFERAFIEYTGASFAIGVNSGTAGLHLCVRAAGIGPGDLVITTPFSFVSSSNILLFEQAVPVFVDVNPLTGNIDVDQVRQAAGDLIKGGAAAAHWLPRSCKGSQVGRLKAILPVDVFGQPADLDPILEIAGQYDLKVIEDSCEALGAEYKGRKAGILGDMGVFAFYPNKQITTAEGGMIVTNDQKAAEMMLALRNQGRAVGDTWLSHTYLGYNYRLDELSAALGVSQMARIDRLIDNRQRVAKWYEERLAGIPLIEPPCLEPFTTRVSWFVYVIRLAKGLIREQIADQLKQKGIPVRPYFLPIHLQPYMVERFGYLPGDFPITEDLGNRGLALPFSGQMTEDQVDLVCSALRDVLE